MVGLLICPEAIRNNIRLLPMPERIWLDYSAPRCSLVFKHFWSNIFGSAPIKSVLKRILEREFQNRLFFPLQFFSWYYIIFWIKVVKIEFCENGEKWQTQFSDFCSEPVRISQNIVSDKNYEFDYTFLSKILFGTLLSNTKNNWKYIVLKYYIEIMK